MNLLLQLTETLNKKNILEVQRLIIENPYLHDCHVEITQYEVDHPRLPEKNVEACLTITHDGPGEWIEREKVIVDSKDHHYSIVPEGDDSWLWSLGHEPKEVVQNLFPHLITHCVQKRWNDNYDHHDDLALESHYSDGDTYFAIIRMVEPTRFNKPDHMSHSALNTVAFRWSIKHQGYEVAMVGSTPYEHWWGKFNSYKTDQWDDKLDHDPDDGKVLKSMDELFEYIERRCIGED